MRFVLILLLAAGSLNAQAGSSGHVYYAPAVIRSYGGNTFTHGIGGGYNKGIWRGVGFLGDIGWFFPGDRPDIGVGLGSLNASYHFVSSARVEPFVTGGYGFMFRSRVNNMANFGGGAIWWFGRRTGLRVELRHHTDRESRGDNVTSFRIGLGFR